VTIDTHSSDEDLLKAGRLLTSALKPPPARLAEPAHPSPPFRAKPVGVDQTPKIETPISDQPKAAIQAAAPAPVEAAETIKPAEIQSALQAPEPAPVAPPPLPGINPALAALFHETDALVINGEIFRHLGLHFGIKVQDVRLSLPCVFENRRFEIINFEHRDIDSVMELRGDGFYGFYLSHVNERKILLVFACNGAHLEWGPEKCMLQPSVKAEPDEYKGSALLGFAQDHSDQFVFVVQPAFKEWIKPHEINYAAELVHFVTVAELEAAAGRFTLVWPQAPIPR
jgi:hypothetical protein